MPVSSGWIDLPGIVKKVLVVSCNKRFHLLLYDIDQPTIYCIMWGHQHTISSITYNPKTYHLYTIDAKNNLKIWKWNVSRLAFNHIGTVNRVQSLILDSDIKDALFEVEHINNNTFAYHINNPTGVITRLSPLTWKPRNHKLYPKEIREIIEEVWLIWSISRTYEDRYVSYLGELPPELIFNIVSYVACGRPAY